MKITPEVKLATKQFLGYFIRLMIAGFVLGALHKHQWILFSLLVFYAVFRLHRRFLISRTVGLSYTIGFFLTLSIGTTCELWGTYFQYWTYHDIPSYQLIPVWIPVAWGITYFTFHTFERCFAFVTQHFKLNFSLMTLCCVILPTVGEYIPIYMGVWTYHWPYQFMGVPLLASLGLFGVHQICFIAMSKINAKFRFNDDVYNTYGPIFIKSDKYNANQKLKIKTTSVL